MCSKGNSTMWWYQIENDIYKTDVVGLTHLFLISS